MHTVREDEGPVELCVSFMTPPSLDQVDNLEVFLNTMSISDTAGELRLAAVMEIVIHYHAY